MTPHSKQRSVDERLDRMDAQLSGLQNRLDSFADDVGITAIEQR